MPGTRGRPRKGEEGKRNEAIFAAAIAEFSLKGFSGASIDEIARRAGASKMTIYKYFGDKEGLFRAMSRVASAPIQNRVARIKPGKRPPSDVLEEYARAMRYDENDGVAFGLLRLAVFEQHRFPQIAQGIYRSGIETLKPLSLYIEGLIGRGILRPDDPEQLTVHFCSLVTRGHRFLLMDEDEAEAQAEFIRRAVDLFLRGAVKDRQAIDR